jgi:hypothetical protein
MVKVLLSAMCDCLHLRAGNSRGVEEVLSPGESNLRRLAGSTNLNPHTEITPSCIRGLAVRPLMLRT